MDFWNEYEGKTIAESYPLEKLLYPEGRSGFFSTWNGTGTLAVMRLTESLNDQQEMLEQWQVVRKLNHPNLIAILKCGETVVDDVPLVYAVLEPPDATLADILAERPMTVDETLQIATSLVPALQALHDNGLIHGHIEPSSVRAVGEAVKLRSDCVRTIADDQERKKLIFLEVQDLCVVLQRALTQQRGKVNPNSPAPSLPAPFDRIVPKGLSGAWGLEEILAALKGSAAPQSRAVAPVAPVAPVAAGPALPTDKSAAPVEEQTRTAPLSRNTPERLSEDLTETGRPWPRPKLPWVVVALALLVAIAGWYMLRTSRSNKAAAPENQSSAPSSASPAAPPPSQAAPAVAASPAIDPATRQNPPVAQGRDVWRLVVYTYNRQSEAEGKAAAIKRDHASFDPEVFTPSGHSPYLVALGGYMSRQDASALLRKARSDGFPRDSYVQNYAAK